MKYFKRDQEKKKGSLPNPEGPRVKAPRQSELYTYSGKPLGDPVCYTWHRIVFLRGRAVSIAHSMHLMSVDASTEASFPYGDRQGLKGAKREEHGVDTTPWRPPPSPLLQQASSYIVDPEMVVNLQNASAHVMQFCRDKVAPLHSPATPQQAFLLQDCSRKWKYEQEMGVE